MADASDHQASNLPYLPNELRIRILGYIEDPHVLWTVIRRVSPEFKQWTEEQFIHRHLPKLQLELHLIPPEPRRNATLRPSVLNYIHTKTQYLFEFSKLAADDSEAVLEARIPPIACYSSTQYNEITEPRDDDLDLFLDLENIEVAGQVFPELDLGMREGGRRCVCPCRSLRDATKRGFFIDVFTSESGQWPDGERATL
ncbi:hypothetical protein M011DRAFT_477738 [Sporormia fimetaria CBS 119925]|uniref:F-box domain-containing protein n=1 Tax=Sporormia fimetaria CBS 119925 TaxID=1340428 RepID=A0A6A6V9Y5_9PLEO|nr:hypothetical protein M011DRAFT_477738 [Sporormia fimetaria CBS 119925]